MKVSIIIPTYNTVNLLKKNVPELIKAYKNSKNNICEIIIVDDGSSDGSSEYIRSNHPEVKLIKHKINRGFSAAVNTGARTAKGGLLCLLNTDVVPSPNFLEKVLPHFKSDNVFAVSLNEVGMFSWAKGYFKDGFVGHEPAEKDNNVHDTFWVSGGSGVFKRSLWMEVGGMDEKLFSPFYWEDVDLSYRAAKRGFQLLWEPGAIVTHKHESTMKLLSPTYVSRIRERNHLLFIWKNITSENMIRKHVWALLGKILKHPGYLRIIFMALLKIDVVLKEHYLEKKYAKISDEAIFARFN